jgi:hypothetical protein
MCQALQYHATSRSQPCGQSGCFRQSSNAAHSKGCHTARLAACSAAATYQAALNGPAIRMLPGHRHTRAEQALAYTHDHFSLVACLDRAALDSWTVTSRPGITAGVVQGCFRQEHKQPASWQPSPSFLIISWHRRTAAAAACPAPQLQQA